MKKTYKATLLKSDIVTYNGNMYTADALHNACKEFNRDIEEADKKRHKAFVHQLTLDIVMLLVGIIIGILLVAIAGGIKQW